MYACVCSLVCLLALSLACQCHVPSRAAPDWFPAAVLRSHTHRAAPHSPAQPGPARCAAAQRRAAQPSSAQSSTSLRSAAQPLGGALIAPLCSALLRSPPLAGAPAVTQSCWPLNSPGFMETPVGSSFEYCHAQHRARRLEPL
uniref:Protein tyrosine phosphatase type IVA 3 isoform X2 n=1 Tax=Phascolarctos cinereus TaxID=38626 RepID=A0A6P5KX73_PHACI|nr:protein tyrosine phosphatase type IVA 3 isoform X2 [Phascolarctos cinereus]